LVAYGEEAVGHDLYLFDRSPALITTEERVWRRPSSVSG
jgi:hypothetical protein